MPLFEMTEAKRNYTARDLSDWAEWWGEPFVFPSSFPIRTIGPLRAALAEPRLTMPIYRAAWSRDMAIDKPEVLGAIIESAGFDARAIFEKTQDPELKARLRQNTDEAQEVGVCGVPTFQVTPFDAEAPFIIWGQDRLAMLELALNGWAPACG